MMLCLKCSVQLFEISRVSPISAEFYDQYGDEMTYLVEGIWLGSIKCDIVQ